MNLFVKLFLFACMYCVLPILYFMMRNETQAKKNIVLGVTLPWLARGHAEVQAVCDGFRRSLRIAFWVLTALALAGLAFPWLSVCMTWLFLWVDAAILVPGLLYVRSHRRLEALKLENGWYGALSGKTVVDLRAAGRPARRVPWIAFLPPLLLCLAPLLFADGALAVMLPLSLSLFALTLLCAALYQIIWRQASDTVDSRTELTAALTQVRRHNWARCFLALTWTTGLYALPMCLFWDRPLILLLATAVYTVVVLAACIGAEFAARRAQEKLTAGSGTEAYVDEDRWWLWGMFYCNPDDRHLIKNNRVGVGATINLARPLGKLTLGFALLCLVALPILGGWMMAEEFTPVRTELRDGVVVAIHLRETCAIPLEDVTQTQVLETLPPMTKLVGTGIDRVRKGSFRVEGYGACSLCLDPTAGPFLLLETPEDVHLLSPDPETLAAILTWTAG